jgi:hypothetical protein
VDLVLDPCEDLPFVREQSARIVGPRVYEAAMSRTPTRPIRFVKRPYRYAVGGV